MTTTRIYQVKRDDGSKPRLVRASTPAQAVRHVIRNEYIADVASQDDLVALLGSGVTVEAASAEPQP